MRLSLVTMGVAGMALLGLAAPAVAPARTPQEQRNLDIAMDFIVNVLPSLQLDRFKDYVAPHFIEHHPGVDGNLESLLGYFREVKKSNPNGLPKPQVIVSTADGDLVTIVLVRSQEKDPHDSSKSILKLGVEVIRLKNGKQVEHWDEEMNPGDVPPQPTVKSIADAK